jgi:U3 small nucleolar RNA-associated protein 21
MFLLVVVWIGVSACVKSGLIAFDSILSFLFEVTFSSPPTSLTLSPTGEFLATSHQGKLAINLWCDKSFFRMVHLDGTPTEPSKMNEPCPVAECEQEGASDAVLQSFLASSVKKDIITNGEEITNDEADNGVPPTAKEEGLITLSGLPPAHWKNLFHLELVKERNKTKEAPQKPPQAPFFLQWRAGLESELSYGNEQAKSSTVESDKEQAKETEPDGWDAVWSDDEGDNGGDENTKDVRDMAETQQHSDKQDFGSQNKRMKVVHERTHLAALLRSCSFRGSYAEVTEYLATMGPSAIDVELSSLCYGSHDLDEGLPLLHLASSWLLEVCKSHQSFEAVNAYLHRFLHVHGSVIAAIETRDGSEEVEYTPEMDDLKLCEFKETISQLREEQRSASNRLQGKIQHVSCLLRHFSRMV